MIPDSGQFWVSYEAKHGIRRFSRSFARSTGFVRPIEMQDWPSNKGAEALSGLPMAGFLVIAESLEDDDTHQALLFSGDPVEPGTDIDSFTYGPPAGYRVTDGVQLPDGRLMILNRWVGLPNGFAAKLALVDPSRLGRNKLVTGQGNCNACRTAADRQYGGHRGQPGQRSHRHLADFGQ